MEVVDMHHTDINTFVALAGCLSQVATLQLGCHYRDPANENMESLDSPKPATVWQKGFPYGEMQAPFPKDAANSESPEITI